METKNAIIGKVRISNEDHGCLSMWLMLDYGGSGQGFGGYNLYSGRKDGRNVCGYFIDRVLKVVGVSDVDSLQGQTIRVKSNHTGIESIGHIVKDIWFTPSEDLKEFDKPS